MGKTGLNKLELASRRLNLCENEPTALVGAISSSIMNSDCQGVQINAISYQLIADVIFALTAIPISSSNLSYYKHNSSQGDIVADIAKELGVPLCSWVSCKIAALNGQLKIEPKPNGAVAAFYTLLEKSPGSEALDAYYLIWSANGWHVGDKRNWIQPSLLKWLQQNNVKPSIPVSHCRPTELKAVYRKLAELAGQVRTNIPVGQTINDWVDDKVLDFCNSAIISRTKKVAQWLSGYPNLPPIQFVDVVKAEFRLTPYLYCRRLDDLCSKFGKAHNSVRFKASDMGIVIHMKRDTDDVLTQCEYIILNELVKRDIIPLEGTQERFLASYRDLCKVVLDICEATPLIRSKIISITATY